MRPLLQFVGQFFDKTNAKSLEDLSLQNEAVYFSEMLRKFELLNQFVYNNNNWDWNFLHSSKSIYFKIGVKSYLYGSVASISCQKLQLYAEEKV